MDVAGDTCIDPYRRVWRGAYFGSSVEPFMHTDTVLLSHPSQCYFFTLISLKALQSSD